MGGLRNTKMTQYQGVSFSKESQTIDDLNNMASNAKAWLN